VFEYSIRDFFECQNDVEVCWFHASVCSIRDFFEAQKDVCCGDGGLMFFCGQARQNDSELDFFGTGMGSWIGCG
jgi:hypothetical protein